jgi:mRNA interferase MazF
VKDYKDWMPVKADIHNKANRPKVYKKGEIWLCNIGENIGYENDGKGQRFVRPVLIAKKYSDFTCHIVPLSTTQRRGRFYYPFDGHTGKVSVALLTQSRTIDSSRLHRKIGAADIADYDSIIARMGAILGVKEFTPAQGGGDTPRQAED